MTALPPAGWYPDPEAGGTAWRWWDGVRWAPQLPTYAYGYGPPQTYGVAPAYLAEKYRAATSKFGNWLRWAMLANMVSFLLIAVTMAATFRGKGFDLLHNDQFGQPEISDRVAALQLVTLPLGLVAYAYLGTFIAWIFQAGKFAEARGWPAARGRTLGAFSTLIPIVQWWWPYEALRDSYPPGTRHPVLLRWWVSYLVAQFVSVPMFFAALFGNATVIAAAILLPGIALAISVWLGWKVISDVEAMQRAACRAVSEAV
jgi:hypothetical protein